MICYVVAHIGYQRMYVDSLNTMEGSNYRLHGCLHSILTEVREFLIQWKVAIICYVVAYIAYQLKNVQGRNYM